MYNLFIICMLTYALSSVWLYSPGLIAIVREAWINYFKEIKYFSWLQYLAICQLCSGFWLGIISSIITIPFDNLNLAIVLITIIVYSLIAAVFSWTLGAITNAFLWIKALCEKVTLDK